MHSETGGAGQVDRIALSAVTAAMLLFDFGPMLASSRQTCLIRDHDLVDADQRPAGMYSKQGALAAAIGSDACD